VKLEMPGMWNICRGNRREQVESVQERGQMGCKRAQMGHVVSQALLEDTMCPGCQNCSCGISCLPAGFQVCFGLILSCYSPVLIWNVCSVPLYVGSMALIFDFIGATAKSLSGVSEWTLDLDF
jgi:hypothetical protein